MLDPLTLERLRAEVRAMRARYRGTPSVLNAPFAMRGNGGPPRPVEDGPGHSLWEWAWLIIDRESNPADAFAALREEYKGHPVLHIVGVVLLASATLDEARERARVLASLPATTWQEGMNDRGPWVKWLAGQRPLPPVSATPGDDAVVAALEGDWARCTRLTHVRDREPQSSAIPIGDEQVMHVQLLRQIWSRHKRHSPDVDVLKKSLATIFSHWGRTTSDACYAGIAVGSRLPLLGMIARLAEMDPLALLFEQRQLNRHLMEPPARAFTLPKDVDDAYAAYEALLTEAITHGGTFTRAPDLQAGVTLVPVSAVNGRQTMMTFRVNPSSSSTSFVLPVVPGETVAQLKERASVQAGPHHDCFLLEGNGRALKLVESVDALLGGAGVTFDIRWETCSHSAPAHPITGVSTCFWDGSRPSDDAEY